MPLSASEVEQALASWPEAAGGAVRLLNHSENQTFRVDVGGKAGFTLRIHRDGYQSRAAIESELTWLHALRNDTDLPIPEPVHGGDGSLLQTITDRAGLPHLAVMFRFIEGHEPRPDDDLVPLFTTLGGYAAQLHEHAATWLRPPGFTRPTWNAHAILAADGLWGDWRKAPGVSPEHRLLFDRLEIALSQQVDAYGTAPDRFGLIHGDMRLGNILASGDTISLIDFDDCGYGWFAYDFAAAISFHECRVDVPALKAAWLESYRRIRRLTEEDTAMMEAMILLRRMALLAWIGSHGETMLAQQHEPGFADGTAQLAERWLSGQLFR